MQTDTLGYVTSLLTISDTRKLLPKKNNTSITSKTKPPYERENRTKERFRSEMVVRVDVDHSCLTPMRNIEC
jgi:hypothetical protein